MNSIKTLLMLLVSAALSVACVNLPPAQPIVAVPLLPDEPIFTKSPTVETQTVRDAQFTLETVLFESDNANLLPDAYLKIEEFVKVLQENESHHVLVEGHTDNRGEDAYNQELSELRVNTVYEVLIANGINPERIVTKGFGESQPVANNETEEGQQQNRRVDMTLLNEIP